KRIKDGRHVVLDFYDLLIEDTMACSRNEFDSSFPKGNAGAGLVPPGLAQPTPAGWPGTTIDRTRKRIKDGRHVVLDFYDLLIEATMACSRNEFHSSFPKGNAGAGLFPPGLAQPTPAGWPASTTHFPSKRIKDGRHVVLDFYDLLIEDTM